MAEFKVDSDMSLEDFVQKVNEQYKLKLNAGQINQAVKALEDQWFTSAEELRSLDPDAIAFLELPGQLDRAIMACFGKGPPPVSFDSAKDELSRALEVTGADEVKVASGASRKGADAAGNGAAGARGSLAIDGRARPNGVATVPLSSSPSPSSSSPAPNGAASASAESKMQQLQQLQQQQQQKQYTLQGFIQRIIEESQGNEFVMQGIQRLLKKGIEDAGLDSGEAASGAKGGTIKRKVLQGYLRSVNKAGGGAGAGAGVGNWEADEDLLEEEEHIDGGDERKDGAGLPTGACAICRGAKGGKKQKQLECGHLFCTAPCLRDYIMERVDEKKAVGMTCPAAGCRQELAVSFIQATLTAEEFNSYLEATLMGFIEQDNLTFTCPNDKCRGVISFQPIKPQEVPSPMTEKDAEGNPLTAEAWLHFQEFRVRCRQCNTVFCADCKTVPYHKGFSCQRWLEYQKARHCRYCGAKLDAQNSAPPLQGQPGLRDVCTQQECLEKREVGCGRIKECGCPCGGVRDEPEAECLPCLKHEMDVADEFCSICYVEALKDAPCVQLQNECNHVFHYQCVVNKIKASYPGARISFEFRTCPLCHRDMEHASLTKVQEPVKALQKVVEEKALERLKYEGRTNDPMVVNANGRFYNNPVGFAMHQFLFYMCHQCQKPYFAGGYQCQEANAPFDPKELVCPACQPSSVEDCPVHGKDWLAFKCRYCCRFANWYCWARTHFCDQCHKSGVWQTLCEFRTGKNKKKLWEYDQCPGLRAQVDEVAKDKSLSDDEKEAKVATLTADPVLCELHVPHPPNGLEFGMGCSMCRDKEMERINEEAARKAKEEAEQKRQQLDGLKKALAEHPQGMEFRWTGKHLDQNGVFYWLGTLGGARPWANPADSGYVNLSSSGMMGDSVPVSAAVGREVVRCVTKPVRNSWICFDLVDMSLEPTHYTLRHYSSWDTEALRNWVLEGSNDGVNWTPLKIHKNDKGLSKKGGLYTWPIEAEGHSYRMFRIIQTDVNSNNHFYLACSGAEFYGFLHDHVLDQEALFMQDEKQGQVRHWEFKYEHDFDTKGILYWLGTNMGRNMQWQNPVSLGLVVASASSLAEKPASRPIEAICGRELCRCVTQAKPNQWVMIDFKDKKVRPSHYTIRHYDSWDTEALRCWRFEASNDGVAWTVLRTHNNDESLNQKGATHTWPLVATDDGFSMFRIFQTSKNSNNHYYLACSGLELYGIVEEVPPVKIGPAGLTLSYYYDFDANGLFYWIGTRGKRQPWRNPAQSGLVTASASSLAANPSSAPAWAIVGRELCRCVTAASPGQWFMVDLKDKKIKLSHYTVRHYNSWDTEALRNWVLEGSNDGNNWTIIRDHVNDAALDKKGATYTWPVQCPGFFQMLRLRQTGLNSNNHQYLACSGFEIYGDVLDLEQSDHHLLAPPPAPSAVPRFRDGLTFVYQSDFDTNGIFYWLGTRALTQPYQNPGEIGLVKVTCSPLASQSMPAWAACGREVVRCVSEPKKYSWFQFDLGKIFVVPTAYSLRHYNSWDTEALRQWKLEASVDGKKWKTIMTHKKDKSLDHKGAAATWPIKGVTKSYSVFRITQTGKNSNKHWYLSLSGFELYGTIYSYRHK